MPDPQVVITIPQKFVDDMKKFMSSVQKFQVAAQQTWVYQAPALPQTLQAQHVSQVLIGMKLVTQKMAKLSSNLERGIDRITYMMGNLGKIFTRGLLSVSETLAATVMGPIGWMAGAISV